MKLTGRTQMLWDRYSLSDSLGIIRKLGFEGAEICLENKHFELVPTLLEDHVISHTREVCQTLGLNANSVGCHIDFVHDDFCFDMLKKAIPKIRGFGTDIFILGSCKQVANREEEWRVMNKRLAEMAALAEDHGVLLAPEPEIHCIIRTTADMLELFERIPSDALKVNLDIGHAFLTDEEPLRSIELLGDRIVHLHFENMYRGWHSHQPPSRGDMNLADYFKTLQRVGFDGPAALDMYNVELADVAPEALRFVRAILKEIGN
jgi:sugar phosphate isomerase/epimerase